MGRRNWLFCWTELGAKHVGIVQSLLSRLLVVQRGAQFGIERGVHFLHGDALDVQNTVLTEARTEDDVRRVVDRIEGGLRARIATLDPRHLDTP